MEKPSLPAAYAALTISALVWGGSIVGQKLALGAFSAVETSLIRGIGALGILVPLWWWTEGGRTTLTPRDLKSLSLLGLGVLGNHLLTLFGLRYVGASTAGVLIGASPVVTALLSSLLVRDISFKKVAGGCAVSFAGVALVSGAGGDAPIGDHPWLGGTLVLLGLVSWALYSIGGRQVMDPLLGLSPQVAALPCRGALDEGTWKRKRHAMVHRETPRCKRRPGGRHGNAFSPAEARSRHHRVPWR